MAEALVRTVGSYAFGLIDETPFKCFIMLEDNKGNRFWAANGKLRSEFFYERKVENRTWGMFEVQNLFTNSLIADSSSDRARARPVRDHGQSFDDGNPGQSSCDSDQSSRNHNQSSLHCTHSLSPQIRDRSPHRNQTDVHSERHPSYHNVTTAARQNLAQPVDAPLATSSTPLPISHPPPLKVEVKEDGDEVIEKAPNSASMSLLNKKVRSLLSELKNDKIDLIENQRMDRQSPLHSTYPFEEMRLKPEILMGIYGLGFKHPSKIQGIAIPSLLAEPPKDIIAQSQSGTGKTVAFAVATLQRIDLNLRYPQAVLLSPSYELALQTGKEVERLSKYYTDFKVAFAVPGMTPVRGTKITEQIVVGTPETVSEWATKFHVFDMKKVKVMVLDEADARLVGRDFAKPNHNRSVELLFRQLDARKCQRLFFSSAFDLPSMKLAEKFLVNPHHIRLRPDEQCLDNIRQYYLECKNDSDKCEAIVNLYETLTIGQCVIFCRHRQWASYLAEQFNEKGLPVGLLTGDLRKDVVSRFKDGNTRILITTESLRGIDVVGVLVVINFEVLLKRGLPDFGTYLHRIGRTGRFGRKGLVINMVESSVVDRPGSVSDIRKIREHFGTTIDKLDVDDIVESDH